MYIHTTFTIVVNGSVVCAMHEHMYTQRVHMHACKICQNTWIGFSLQRCPILVNVC